jgi:hypothetical protein
LGDGLDVGLRLGHGAPKPLVRHSPPH